ncbi:MAG: hypothetical protein CVU61_02350 [Deltaproteobacteria bacterium HGW-Deltaproteobacteria-19]|nr:MAG: hypothetical protein CVU61_02350 [Deltaproteobacteria bacterium HGW-Deltaproteobacteria-19]
MILRRQLFRVLDRRFPAFGFTCKRDSWWFHSWKFLQKAALIKKPDTARRAGKRDLQSLRITQVVDG